MSLLVLVAAAAGTGLADPVPACRAVRVAHRAGEVVQESDTVLSGCAATRQASRLRYDVRKQEVRALVDLQPGDPLGHAWFSPAPVVSAGDQVRITAKLGHVVLSRVATALQSARPGQPYFVRSADGQIFVAPAPEKSSE